MSLVKGDRHMLILTRRQNEAIILGDDIKVVVLGVKGNQVRLGIEAPRTCSVHREEIYVKIQNEKKDTQQVNMDDDN